MFFDSVYPTENQIKTGRFKKEFIGNVKKESCECAKIEVGNRHVINWLVYNNGKRSYNYWNCVVLF